MPESRLIVNIELSPRSPALLEAINEIAEYVDETPWCGLADAVKTIVEHMSWKSTPAPPA